MVKILIELTKEEDKNVEMYKIAHDLKSKQEAIKQMIGYFKADIKPKRIKEEAYFKW